MITPELVDLGIAFYDALRAGGALDYNARHAAVCYMRRKDADVGDAMPYYEALAYALELRAAAKLKAAARTLVQVPQ